MNTVSQIPCVPISGTTKLTALLGSPVAHSISPLMHNRAFQALGLDYAYLCFDVTEETLPSAVAGLKAVGIRGFNVTMPNKNKILELVDQLSPVSRICRSVNTVVNDNGILTGTSTDGTGYMEAVRDAGYDITGEEITMMGGGGASTAICAQAALDGIRRIHIFVRPSSRFYTRTLELAETINRTTACHAEVFNHNDHAALRRALLRSRLLINGTPVGMAPDTGKSIIEDVSLFHRDLVVSDLIYSPRKTRFLQLAESVGCRTFNGMYMLLYQGAESFRIWTGHDMPTDLIKREFFSD